MSVMVLRETSIAGMLQAAAPQYEGETVEYFYNGSRKPFDHQPAGQTLLTENYRSYAARYNERMQKFFPYRPARCRELSAVEIIRLCDSYIINADQSPGWEKSEARAIAIWLKDRACRMLPGYDQAAIDL